MMDDQVERDAADLNRVWEERGPAAFRAALRKMAKEHPVRYFAVCAALIPEEVAATIEENYDELLEIAFRAKPLQ